MELPPLSPSLPSPWPEERLTITIQTFADTACPWSYIAKVVLDRAMKTFQERHGVDKVRFELSWNPFYLWPEMKASSYEKRALLTKLHGADAPAVAARMIRDAALLNIPLSMTGKTGNTRDSHALLLLAQEKDEDKENQKRRQKQDQEQDQDIRRETGHGKEERGQQLQQQLLQQDENCPQNSLLSRLLDALFRGCFEQGRDAADRRFLLAVAREVGLFDADDAENRDKTHNGMDNELTKQEYHLLVWLDSPDVRETVDRMDRAAKENSGIVAVPSFVVQGRYQVGGKQREEVFVDLFERIWREHHCGHCQ